MSKSYQWMLVLECQALVKFVDDGILLLLDVLTDEYELDHAVAHLLIPFLLQLWIVLAQFIELVLRHGGEPLSCLLHRLLLTCLLKYIAHISFVREVADTLGTYHIARPFSGYKLIKQAEVEWLAAIIYEGSDAVFLHFATLMFMFMVVVMVVMVMMFMLIMVVVMMLMFIVVIIVVMVVLVLFLLLVLFIALSLNLLNPARR